MASAPAAASTAAASPAGAPPAASAPARARTFDMGRFRLRHVALHVAYLGADYFGFASQEQGGGDLPDIDGDVAAVPPPPPQAMGRKRARDAVVDGACADSGSAVSGTGHEASKAVLTIETVLFAALARACLIDSAAGAAQARAGAGYTRCGRTDRGVSAGGQVISLRLRSRAARFDVPGHGTMSPAGLCSDAAADLGAFTVPVAGEGLDSATASADGPATVSADAGPVLWRRGDGLANTGAAFPAPDAELDYVAALNGVLPHDVRVLGWADVPERFSARFSATTRTYRYYFVRRDLDLRAMGAAGAALVGTHDFRNVCKVDIGNTQNFVREVLSVRICAAEDGGECEGASADGGYATRRVAAAVGHTSSRLPIPGLSGGRGALSAAGDAASPGLDDPSLLALPPLSLLYVEVVGRAFLWHQIRCVAALLFLVGRGAETPVSIAALLDVRRVRARPQYAMAGEAPLVLFHCGFGEEGGEEENGEEGAVVEEEDCGEQGLHGAAALHPQNSSTASLASSSSLSAALSVSPPAPSPTPQRRVRYLRALPRLHASWHVSAAAQRRLTATLEAQWSAAALRAALLRALLDRAYAGRVRLGDVEAVLTSRGSRGGTCGARAGAGTGAGADAGAGAGAALAGDSAQDPPAPATLTWAAALDRFGGRGGTLRCGEPLASPADAEYLVLPPASAGASRRGCHQPLLQRATGKSVGQKWLELSPAQRADIERKHGTNAPRLAAEVVRGLAADKAEAGEDGTAELEEVGGAATGN